MSDSMTLLLEASLTKDRAIEQLLLDNLREMRKVNARLEAIERATATPTVYTRKQACSRLGISATFSREHQDALPPPVSTSPLRFAVAEVEAMVDRSATASRRVSA